MLNTALTANRHDQHLLIAAGLAVAYVAYVIDDPTQGQCTTSPSVYAMLRVLLVSERHGEQFCRIYRSD